MLSRPAGPTRGHFVLPRFLVLSVTPALPATAGLVPGRPSRARAGPAPEPGTARRPLLSPCRAARPAPGLVILAETPPQTSRSSTSSPRGNGTSGTATGLLRRSRPTWLRVGLAPP
jgi:hypothetical protein